MKLCVDEQRATIGLAMLDQALRFAYSSFEERAAIRLSYD
jgi:hypothetical protein